MPFSLALLVLLTAAAPAGGRTCKEEEGSCAVRGSSLLQAGSRVAIKDFAAAQRGDGFTIHLFNSKEAMSDPDSVVVRQLFKKTYKCRSANPSTCQECSDGRDCFRTRQSRSGKEHMYVATRRAFWWPWRHHRIRVNFHCPEAAQFTISARVQLKGRLNQAFMKVDGEPANDRWYDVRGSKKSVLFTTVWNSTKGRVLELDLHFMMFYGGWAKVMDIQIQTSSEYLACEDHKSCLKVLDGTAEGLGLRNDNQLQLSCLEGRLPGNSACSEWKACLDSAMSTDRIRTLLLAAGVNESSQAQTAMLLEAKADEAASGADLHRAEEDTAEGAEGEARRIEKDAAARQVPEDSCIDPRIDDPESWLCSCLDHMEETCLAISNAFEPGEWSTQHCLTAQMCVDPLGQVCSAWKEAVGCNGTEFAELKAALNAYTSGTGTGSTPAPSTTLMAASDPAVALQQRAWGNRRHLQVGSQMMDASLGGKASACE